MEWLEAAAFLFSFSFCLLSDVHNTFWSFAGMLTHLTKEVETRQTRSSHHLCLQLRPKAMPAQIFSFLHQYPDRRLILLVNQLLLVIYHPSATQFSPLPHHHLWTCKDSQVWMTSPTRGQQILALAMGFFLPTPDEQHRGVAASRSLLVLPVTLKRNL